jgi:hypothetical protein
VDYKLHHFQRVLAGRSRHASALNKNGPTLAVGPQEVLGDRVLQGPIVSCTPADWILAKMTDSGAADRGRQHDPGDGVILASTQLPSSDKTSVRYALACTAL